jgi:hypothetical protein
MEAVVLPEETKILISKTVQSLSLFKSLGLHIPVARLGKLGDSEDVVVACGGYISQV